MQKKKRRKVVCWDVSGGIMQPFNLWSFWVLHCSDSYSQEVLIYTQIYKYHKEHNLKSHKTFLCRSYSMTSMLVMSAWLSHIRFYTNNRYTVGCSCNMVQYSMIWGLCCQKQASQAGISNYIPQFTVGCNYLSLSEIHHCSGWSEI